MQTLIERWLHIDHNTSATIIISTIVFVAGLLFAETVKSINGIIERKKIRRIFRISISKLEKSISKQSSAYLQYAQSLNFESKNQFKFSNVTLPSIAILNEIGYKASYEAFFSGIENVFSSKLKLKAYQGMWTIIVAIPQWQQEAKQKVDEFIQAYNRFNESRNASLGEFMKLIEPYLAEHKDNLHPRPFAEFLAGLDNILCNYQKTSDYRRPDTTELVLVQQMLKHNRQHRFHSIIHEFNPPLLRASIAFENMETALKVYSSQSFKYYIAFRGSRRVMARYKMVLL